MTILDWRKCLVLLRPKYVYQVSVYRTVGPLVIKSFLSEIIRGMTLILCKHDLDIFLYIDFFIQFNLGCYCSVEFPMAENGKIGNWDFQTTAVKDIVDL